MLINLAPIGLRKAFVFVSLSVGILLGSGGVGRADGIIDCVTNPAALVAAAAASATQFLGPPSIAGNIQLRGVCVGPIVISQATSVGAVITPYSSSPGGSILGMVTVNVPNVTLSNVVIEGTGAVNSPVGVKVTAMATGTVLSGVTIQHFPDSGVNVGAGNVNIIGGLITGNANCGVYLYASGMAWLNGNAEIASNGIGTPAGSAQCGVDIEDGASMAIGSANIHDNLGGPALRIFMAMADVTGGSFQSPASITYPTIAVERGSLGLKGATVTGTGQSNALFASPGSTVKMQNSTLSQSDPANATILVADGSVLLSVGGNTITNSAGQALTVANAGTFHQRNEASMGIPLAADIITGGGIVQVQSNMELGTGNAASSTWTGSISVQQNSSFRMDGGMTISGAVQIAQGSNAFFNTGATGKNIVAGGVTCPGTATAPTVSHVAAPTNVFLADGTTSAVTVGPNPPACPKF